MLISMSGTAPVAAPSELRLLQALTKLPNADGASPKLSLQLTESAVMALLAETLRMSNSMSAAAAAPGGDEAGGGIRQAAALLA